MPKRSGQFSVKIKLAFADEGLAGVKTIYSDFQNRHPGAAEFKDAKSIYEKVYQPKKQKEKYEQSHFTHYNNRNLASIYMGADDKYHWLRLKNK